MIKGKSRRLQFVVDDLSGVELKRVLLNRQIMSVFLKSGNKTIADLCQITNSSIPTVNSSLSFLLKQGWVLNYGTTESRGGRKPAMYGINPKAGYTISIDLSRNYTSFAVYNLHSVLIDKVFSMPIGIDSKDIVLDRIKQSLNNLLIKLSLSRELILGVGIALPGLIDINSGVSYSYDLFNGEPVYRVFETLLELPCFIEHDTRAMALGEKWFGIAGDINNALLINVGTGIGLSMILNGELYRGKSGFAGEFGHINIVSDGQRCYCGKIGCLETVASGSYIANRANSIIGSKQVLDNPLTFSNVIERAVGGDIICIEILEEACEYLAKGLSSVIHIFNPDAVIIGGEMSKGGEFIRSILDYKLSKYTINLMKNDTSILVSNLNEQATLLGMIPVVLSNIFCKEV